MAGRSSPASSGRCPARHGEHMRRSWRINSSASGSFRVMMRRRASASIGRRGPRARHSLRARAAFASPGPMEAAISAPVTPPRRSCFAVGQGYGHAGRSTGTAPLRKERNIGTPATESRQAGRPPCLCPNQGTMIVRARRPRVNSMRMAWQSLLAILVLSGATSRASAARMTTMLLS